MTIQRQTGLFLSIFTSAVVFNHWAHGELTSYDIVYGIIIPLLGFTAIFESTASKLIQVFIMALVGALMVYAGGDSIYLGVVIMAVTALRAFTYGFLISRAMAKIVSMGSVFSMIIIVSTGFDLLRAAVWVMMGGAILWHIWTDLSILVEKAKQADEADKRRLEQKLETSEALLEETVKAGMVLVDEIKSKEIGNGCTDK